MAFWRRWKRQRTRVPPGTPPVIGGFVSSGYAGRTLYGKQVVRIGDPEKFRQEDAMRDRARTALDADDESQAQAVGDLVGRYAAVEAADPSAAAAAKQEIQAIGRLLCRDGGSERMKLVAFRVQELSPGNTYGTVRSMESFWDGICGWRV